jgi:Helicase associated domain
VSSEPGAGHVTEYNNCRVPAQYKSSDGYKLATWFSRQRRRKQTLSHERIELLDALGFEWDPLTSKWENGFEHLKAYAKEHNNCRVPMLYKSSDGYNLGRWVDNTRQNARSASPKQKARLDALGFYWNPRDTDWQNGLTHFRAFVNEQKHCRIPQRYKSPDGFNLGVWVNTLRRRKNTLIPERIQILTALGFIWKIR